MSESIFDTTVFEWVLLPAFIFGARVCDVSFGTLRIIFSTRGYRLRATALGFFEVSIWLLALGQIFQNLHNPVYFIAYAGGFVSGIYVGMYIENKMALGIQIIRIITRRDASALVEQLKSEGYGITVVDGEGTQGPVKVIFSLIKRKELPNMLHTINQFNPNAMFSVEDVRMAEQAAMRPTPTTVDGRVFSRFKWQRLGK